MTEYVTRREFTTQKARLTRAKNSGPLAVLVAVEKTLDEWQGKAWPDDWHRWRAALDDAFYAAVRPGSDCAPLAPETVARFHACADRLF